MVNRFETYFVAYYAYFTAELILKALGQFENLVFAIMSTRENIHLMARTPLSNQVQAMLQLLKYSTVPNVITL